jgi:hypothetical protein
MPLLQVVAVNRAANHPNLIHNDEYARSVGFRGGLVPGVDVYAYLTRLAVANFGKTWLERGEGEVRFIRPVYEGDQLDIEATGDGSDHLNIAASCDGEVRAVLSCRDGSEHEFDATDEIPEAPISEPKLRAEPQSFYNGMVLGSLTVAFTENACLSQLADVQETFDLYRIERIVHPGHLLRFADQVLSANVDLPPWLHAGSFIHHFGLVHWNESITVRARVLATYARKRHRFIELDVLALGIDGRPRFRVRPYKAIYKPFFPPPEGVRRQE